MEVLNVLKNFVLRKVQVSFWLNFSFLKRTIWPTSPKLFTQQRFLNFLKFSKIDQKSKITNWSSECIQKNIFFEKFGLFFCRSFSFSKNKMRPTSPKLFTQQRFLTFLKFSKIDQNSKITNWSLECAQKTYSSKSTNFILAKVFIFVNHKLDNFIKFFSSTTIFDFFEIFENRPKFRNY